MKRLKSKIRYFFIGFSVAETLGNLIQKIFRSKLLYFYLLIAFFVFYRGYLPMSKYTREAELLEVNNPIENVAIQNQGFVGEQEVLQKEEKTGLAVSEESVREIDSQYENKSGDIAQKQSPETGMKSDTKGNENENNTIDTRLAFGNTEGKGYTIDEFNALTAKELEIFKGIGKATAAAIVELRTVRGGFSTFDELLDVKGIGAKKLKKIMGGE